MKLALGHGAITEEARRDSGALLHLVGEGEPDRNGEASADDGVTAVEASLCIEDVHRSTAAVATAFVFAVHLGHEGSIEMPRASA